MNRILRQVRKAALFQAAKSASDAELLEMFLRQRDEAAFEAILRRHAAIVMGVCRRVLRHAEDAEDAFQATFLVLARKAESLRSRDLLGPWLYGIALRTALKARAMNVKRRERESQVRTQQVPKAMDRPTEELLARLDTEIARLPEKYRLAVILCELQGKSRKDAATLLGVPEGTLSSRLAYARRLLAQRLCASEALCGVLLAGAFAPQSSAVSRFLLKATPRAALEAVGGQVPRAGLVSVQVLTLTEGVMKAMFVSKLKGVGAVVLALALGVGGLTYRQAWAQTSGPGNAVPAARTATDELEELRMEVAALRKGLEITRQRVRVLERRLDTQSRIGGPVDPVQQVPLIGRLYALPGANTPNYKAPQTQPSSTTTPAYQPPLLQPSSASTPANQRPQTQPSSATTPAYQPPQIQSSSATSGRRPAQGLTRARSRSRPADPLSAAEAALKRLREHPGDQRAADRLQDALRLLRERETAQPGGKLR